MGGLVQLFPDLAYDYFDVYKNHGLNLKEISDSLVNPVVFLGHSLGEMSSGCLLVDVTKTIDENPFIWNV